MGEDTSIPFDLSQSTVGLLRDGTSDVETNTPGPPRRVDGFVVGAHLMTRNAPHSGEMHPDGDELLYLLSGKVEVVLEENGELEERGQERVVVMSPGQGLVVPRGVWHRVVLREASQLVHITPGPGGQHRPLRDDDPD